MIKNYMNIYFFMIPLLFTSNILCQNSQKEADSINYVIENFKDPPVEFRSAPLWVWNDKVTENQIYQQLRDFKSVGIGGVFIHPRPGLITSYLSDEWHSLCNYTVEQGKKLGMKIWLYDENSYPSGFAGGHVPAEYPESFNQGQGLELLECESLPKNSKDYFLILKKEKLNFIDITINYSDYTNIPGSYYLYKKTYYHKSPWFGGYSYVDLLLEGVTEKFIELTMKGYEEKIGNEFGRTVPGIFTDEPNISTPGGIRWTPSLFEEFKERWNYDLKINLPSLTHEIGNWKRIRHNYFKTLLDLFIERWSIPWFNYCEENNLVWTGHYWEHGWPDPHHGSDNMAMYAWHQMPGIDVLMNQYSENVNAQFGNIRAVKELSSIANQFGRKRTLSETYGAGGWEMTFEEMKRIGDWEYVLGVNFLNQHLSYMTIEGARKRDHPLSFSYHAPWWEHYKLLGDYFARLSLALSSGSQINKVVVIEPTTTSWLYYSVKESNSKLKILGPAFQQFITDLEKYQIEYDLASEQIIEIEGEIKDNYFSIGEMDYSCVIIPPGLENINFSTYQLLKSYLKNNGKILSFSDTEFSVDGEPSNSMELLRRKYVDRWIMKNSISESHADLYQYQDISFLCPESANGKLFHHRRQFEDGQILFLVNSSSDEWSKGKVRIKGGSVHEMDLLNGVLRNYPFTSSNNKLTVSFDLPPVGSLMLKIDNASSEGKVEVSDKTIEVLKAIDEVKINNSGMNALTIDYCDLSVGNLSLKNTYFFKASDELYKYHGFDGNPWSRAVQYKTSIIDRGEIINNSGFEVRYSFIVEDGIELNELYAVIEQPTLWELNINGKSVEQLKDEYLIDRKFGKYDISRFVNSGINTITLAADKMTIHSEIEPIYIFGDFNLLPNEKGWILTRRKELPIGSWKQNGLPFYSNVISYEKSYNIQNQDKRVVVKLTSWAGAVAEIIVNDKNAGLIAWPPYELDITNYFQGGENKISVNIYGTLKNLLGPHHVGPVRGTAWPASFESAPDNIPSGNEYDFVDYGLFADFLVLEYEGPQRRISWKMETLTKPTFENEDSIFFDQQQYVTFAEPPEGVNIFYSLDGSAPGKSSFIYKSPIQIKSSSHIKAIAMKDGSVPSKIVTRNYFIIDQNKNGVHYKYYEGEWTKLPNFNELSSKREGHIYELNLKNIETRTEKYGIVYLTNLLVEAEGDYHFYLASNDGSKLLISDTVVIDNDGSHGHFEKQGKIALKRGMHPMKIVYFDAGGKQSLNISYKTPKGNKQDIPLENLYYPNN